MVSKNVLFDSLSVWENIMFKSLENIQTKLIEKILRTLLKVGLSKKIRICILLNCQVV